MRTERSDRPKPSETSHDAAPVKTPTEARQGRAYRRLRYVLVVGIALVVLAILATSLFTPEPPTRDARGRALGEASGSVGKRRRPGPRTVIQPSSTRP